MLDDLFEGPVLAEQTSLQPALEWVRSRVQGGTELAGRDVGAHPGAFLGDPQERLDGALEQAGVAELAGGQHRIPLLLELPQTVGKTALLDLRAA